MMELATTSRPVSSRCIALHSMNSSSRALSQRRDSLFHPSLRRSRGITTCLAGSELAAVGAFFTPGLLTAAYALYLGKGNISDGASAILNKVGQGYFQPNVGGANIPVADGALSDLAGDEPLFKALYKW